MSSTLNALMQLRSLLTTKEKRQWLEIACFAILTSLLELVTAFSIVIFARSLSQPQILLEYLGKVHLNGIIPEDHLLFYLSCFVGLVYLIKNSIVALETFHQNFVISKMQHRCENSLLDHYAKMNYSEYLTKNSSYALASIQDVEEIFSRGVVCLASVFCEAIIFLFLIGMIVYINPRLAMMAGLFGATIYFFVNKFLFPQFYKWGKTLQIKDSLCQKNLLQFFYSFKEIILMGKQENFARNYAELSHDKIKVQGLIRATNIMPRIVLEVLFIGLFVFAVAYLSLSEKSSYMMLGTLAGYLYVGFRLMPGLNRIISQHSIFKSSIPHIDRVYKQSKTLDTEESYSHVPDFQFDHYIKLDHVSFKYKQSNDNVLNDINLTIKKGEYIGIIGETGSGKSTLVDIILGLLKPLEGKVMIDDKYTVSCKEWHRMIGYVPQAIYLMDDTVAANIAYGENSDDIDNEKLKRVIHEAQLDKFIERLPHKEQTIIGDRGILISGGERQRIAIARALYRNPSVLIFDEATSALDSQTEVELMETLNSVRMNRTIITIAHRLTTLKNCDRIISIKNGMIDKITNYQGLSQDFKIVEEKVG